MFYVAVWKFYYKMVHNDLPLYFSAMKPTLPTVCRRYEIRTPMFHLPHDTAHFCRAFNSVLSYKPLKQGYTLYLNNGKGGYRPIP